MHGRCWRYVKKRENARTIDANKCILGHRHKEFGHISIVTNNHIDSAEPISHNLQQQQAENYNHKKPINLKLPFLYVGMHYPRMWHKSICIRVAHAWNWMVFFWVCVNFCECLC